MPQPDDAFTELVVIDRSEEAENVISITLAREDRLPLPPWTPGAHLELKLPSGTIRQYSLCGDPQRRDHYRIAVLRVAGGRGGSAEVHQVAVNGARLSVRGPRNTFALEQADDHLFIAGGIGITPLLPMITTLERERRPWRLIYTGRSRSTMAFTGDLPDDERVEIMPRDENGRLQLDIILKSAGPGTSVYCCGPSTMIDDLGDLSQTHLATGARLHVERFSAGRTYIPMEPPDDRAELRVRLARSGKTITVPASKSILDAVRREVPGVESSCEEGICGTCETRVLCGVPDHRDDFLTESERASGEMIMICVSRALSNEITLDL